MVSYFIYRFINCSWDIEKGSLLSSEEIFDTNEITTGLFKSPLHPAEGYMTVLSDLFALL